MIFLDGGSTMTYGQVSFPSYTELRPKSDNQHEPDDATLKAGVYSEARPLFDMIARTVGKYVETKQERKLRVFFEIMEESLNIAIDAVVNEPGATGSYRNE